MGYLAFGTDAAKLLFQVVNERPLKHRAMVFTTHRPLNAWERVLHDPELGGAIVDRILERGPPVRSRHVDPKDLDGPDMVSGITRPEFPEPASRAPRRPSGTVAA